MSGERGACLSRYNVNTLEGAREDETGVGPSKRRKLMSTNLTRVGLTGPTRGWSKHKN